MKPMIIHSNRGETGSVLITSIIIAGILSIGLASALLLAGNQNRTMVRSSYWNAAMPVAEAGIEEALSHLQAVQHGERAVNGWRLAKVNHGGTISLRHTKWRQMGNAVYFTSISQDATPTITSSGYTRMNPSSDWIRRTVEVTTIRPGLFSHALMAKGKIKLGGQFKSDSFDPDDPTYSTGGQYDPTKSKDRGHVGTTIGTADAIDMNGTVKIYGSMATGVGGGTILGSSVAVGSAPYIDAGNTGFEPGHLRNDLNVNFPDVKEPGGNFFIPAGGTVDGVNYELILDSGRYKKNTLKISGQSQVLVRGNATLVLEQNLILSGQTAIRILPGASLNLYVLKGYVDMGGNSIINETGRASNFSLFGLPTLEEITISGNGELIGTMYAPDADLKLSGSGTDILDFIGAGVVNEVFGNGHFKFHYDESLGAKGKEGELVINSWREI